ncbi:MAG: hypothetical protein ACRD3W_20035, partial [Terriglobales bacterium]
AYLDYLNDEIAHMIPVRAEPVGAFPDDPGLEKLFAGSNWWRPDTDELCATIRAIINGTGSPRGDARQAVSRFTWSNTARTLQELIF